MTDERKQAAADNRARFPELATVIDRLRAMHPDANFRLVYAENDAGDSIGKVPGKAAAEGDAG